MVVNDLEYLEDLEGQLSTDTAMATRDALCFFPLLVLLLAVLGLQRVVGMLFYLFFNDVLAMNEINFCIFQWAIRARTFA